MVATIIVCMISMVSLSVLSFVRAIVRPTTPAVEYTAPSATTSATPDTTTAPTSSAISETYGNLFIARLIFSKLKEVKLQTFIHFEVCQTHQNCAKCCSKAQSGTNSNETSCIFYII